jgi:hypothetical protein
LGGVADPLHTSVIPNTTCFAAREAWIELGAHCMFCPTDDTVFFCYGLRNIADRT